MYATRVSPVRCWNLLKAEWEYLWIRLIRGWKSLYGRVFKSGVRLEFGLPRFALPPVFDFLILSGPLPDYSMVAVTCQRTKTQISGGPEFSCWVHAGAE